MLDLVDPINRGPWREAHRDRTMPFSSWGSPTCRGQSKLRLQSGISLVRVQESGMGQKVLSPWCLCHGLQCTQGTRGPDQLAGIETG